ncbi:MAG: AAA family ATPase [Lachnospiraceae bacterium]|nr:AAA family ATPase [Lachnospiraceae bacterium]
MLNRDILKESILKYKEVFPERWIDESFKWEAIRCFQDNWDINSENFYEMFTAATEKTYSLLVSVNNFPRRMIQIFAETEPETIRQMFVNLFDDNKDYYERILRFQKESEELCERVRPGKQSFQRPMAISVYLWLHNPEKYGIYKYSNLKNVCLYFRNDSIPVKGANETNFKINLDVIQEIIGAFREDEELISMFQERASAPEYYLDKSLITLANDFIIYVSSNLAIWTAEEYSPNISKEEWKKLIKDRDIFTDKSIKIMARMLDIGGQATCTQLAERYGEDYSFYNFGSSELARRVAKKTGCPIWQDENGDNNLWSILYIGRKAKKDEKGVFLWKLRDELKAALEESNLTVDIPHGSLNVNRYSKDNFLDEVFMEEYEYEALKNLLLNKKNIILQGAPGVGKTFAAKRLAYSIMGEKDDSRVEFIQFHQNYTYEDFVMGYKPVKDGFELKSGIFYNFCQKALSNLDKDYFFIIDEINRGNLSKIFGELLMLIEKDYRNEKATLAYTGNSFTVPNNLFIIGMMNTADRSLAMIDYALRRRFSFYSMKPGFDNKGFKDYQNALFNDTFNKLIKVITDLNEYIEQDSSLGKGFVIGHSYFCCKPENDEEDLNNWLQAIVDYDIIPILEEYWFDSPKNVENWSEQLRGVFVEA